MTAGLYDVIGARREVRAEFTGSPVPDDVLDRILTAAHTAPSVGMSQPWDFILVEDMIARSAFHAPVMGERTRFRDVLPGKRVRTFEKIKIEGGIPPSIRPVAWLCVGPVTGLQEVPDLQRHGWRNRLPLSDVVHREYYGNVGA